MTNILQDLDLLVAPDKQVKFGGREFTLPGDMPMETFLRINLAGEKENAAEQLDELVSAISELFAFVHTDSDLTISEIKDHVSKTLRRRGVKYAFKLLGEIYKNDETPKEGEEAPEAEAPAL